MLLNRQKSYALRPAVLGGYLRQLKRQLSLGRKTFNICLVDDGSIRRLNGAYCGKDAATDVLSFPWHEPAGPRRGRGAGRRRAPAARRAMTSAPAAAEFKGFLGEVVISVETARRNALAEGHSTLNEIRWLILHGILHLLGYDHERDHGEMTALEWALRERLGVAQERVKGKKRR